MKTRLVVLLTGSGALLACGGGDEAQPFAPVAIPASPNLTPRSGRPPEPGNSGSAGSAGSAGTVDNPEAVIAGPCISAAQRKAAEAAGLTFYDGDSPPVIGSSGLGRATGTRYLANSLQVVFEGEPAGTVISPTGVDPVQGRDRVADYLYGFRAQDSSGNVSFRFQVAADYAYQDDAWGAARVTGKDGCFTACAVMTGFAGRCDYTTRELVSACLTPEGLKDFKTASFMASKGGGADCFTVLRVGVLRVLAEKDGLVNYE